MTDPFSDTAGRHFEFLTKSKRWGEWPPIRPAQDATQHINHDRQAVSLMSTVLAIRTEREECSPGIPTNSASRRNPPRVRRSRRYLKSGEGCLQRSWRRVLASS